MATHLELYNAVAETVCGKPVEMSDRDCYRSNLSRHPPCRDYGKCCIFDKTDRQLEFVMQTLDVNSYLKACPGSGKTEVIGLFAAYAMLKHTWPYHGMAVLTFTNSAANVIADRISRFARRLSFPHYVGTIDAWLHGYLVNPYGHLVTGYLGKDGDRSVRMISNESEAGFLSRFETEFPYKKCGKIQANQYYYAEGLGNVCFDSGSSNRAADAARQKLPNELPEWQEKKLLLELLAIKKKFWAAGFATHQDVETICFELLSNNSEILTKLATRFRYIVIDECQDLSPRQLRILELLRRHGSYIRMIGDINQAIYSFRQVHPDRVAEFVHKNGFEESPPLTRNFRSVQPIVEVCSQLLDQGVIVGQSVTTAEPACVYFTYDNLALVPSKMESLISCRGLPVARTAILARGSSTLRKLNAIQEDLPDNLTERIATAIHLWKKSDSAFMSDALSCLGLVIAKWSFGGQSHDHRDNDRPESISSRIEWRLFLSRILDDCASHNGLSTFEQPWEAWAKIGRSEFPRIVAKAWTRAEPISTEDQSIRSPKKKGKQEILATLGIANVKAKSKIRMTTIHKIKGETLDAVLVVSSPDRRVEGGHWTHWLDRTTDDGEHARFAYVASSRPRYLLVWAVPTGKPREDNPARIASLGFNLIPEIV